MAPSSPHRPRRALLESRALVPTVGGAALVLSGLLMLPRLSSREAERPPPAESVEAALPQAAASASSPVKPPKPPPPAYVRVDPDSGAACAPGMVLVDGVYCPFVGHRCAAYLDEARDVCKKFSPDVLCEGALAHRRYCIDVYEYPNLEDVKPAVMVDWNDARRACAVEQKRLCTPEEWEFACEGTQMWPYPYGRERDDTACNIDRALPTHEAKALSNPLTVGEEVERVDGRAEAGSFPRCVSPFGVRDLTGNVEEWVDNPGGGRHAEPFRSTLKGGHWGKVRARCRPATADHAENARSPQVGFRCCADAGPRGGAPPPPPRTPAGAPRKRRMVEP
jgi:hypothetical protein